MRIGAIIPIKGEPININGKYLLKHTINYLKKSKFISDIIVSTDNKATEKNNSKKNLVQNVHF